MNWPWFLALLAEACGRAGQVDEGLRVLEEALEAVQNNEDRVYEAEVYRLAGVLLLQRSAEQQGEAEERFQRALDITRQPAGEVVGAAVRHEPGAPVAAPGQARRDPRTAGAGLRLVHRGL